MQTASELQHPAVEPVRKNPAPNYRKRTAAAAAVAAGRAAQGMRLKSWTPVRRMPTDAAEEDCTQQVAYTTARVAARARWTGNSAATEGTPPAAAPKVSDIPVAGAEPEVQGAKAARELVPARSLASYRPGETTCRSSQAPSAQPPRREEMYAPPPAGPKPAAAA